MDRSGSLVALVDPATRDLLFVGRLSADKGVHRSIRVAWRSRWRLVVLAKMREVGAEPSAVRPALLGWALDVSTRAAFASSCTFKDW